MHNFYPPWLIDFVSLLYEKDQTKRPTAAKALGFLKQLLTNPNVIALFNNLKSQKTNLNHELADIDDADFSKFLDNLDTLVKYGAFLGEI